MLTLILLNGQEKGREYQLTGEQAELLGRQAPTIKLSDAQTSRQHAEILLESSTWLIRDMGSTNGTWVNGQKISQITELEVGDRIVVGRHQLRVLNITGLPTPKPQPKAPQPEPVIGSEDLSAMGVDLAESLSADLLDDHELDLPELLGDLGQDIPTADKDAAAAATITPQPPQVSPDQPDAHEEASDHEEPDTAQPSGQDEQAAAPAAKADAKEDDGLIDLDALLGESESAPVLDALDSPDSALDEGPPDQQAAEEAEPEAAVEEEEEALAESQPPTAEAPKAGELDSSGIIDVDALLGLGDEDLASSQPQADEASTEQAPVADEQADKPPADVDQAPVELDDSPPDAPPDVPPDAPAELVDELDDELDALLTVDTDKPTAPEVVHEDGQDESTETEDAQAEPGEPVPQATDDEPAEEDEPDSLIDIDILQSATPTSTWADKDQDADESDSLDAQQGAPTDVTQDEGPAQDVPTEAAAPPAEDQPVIEQAQPEAGAEQQPDAVSEEVKEEEEEEEEEEAIEEEASAGDEVEGEVEIGVKDGIGGEVEDEDEDEALSASNAPVAGDGSDIADHDELDDDDYDNDELDDDELDTSERELLLSPDEQEQAVAGYKRSRWKALVVLIVAVAALGAGGWYAMTLYASRADADSPSQTPPTTADQLPVTAIDRPAPMPSDTHPFPDTSSERQTPTQASPAEFGEPVQDALADPFADLPAPDTGQAPAADDAVAKQADPDEDATSANVDTDLAVSGQADPSATSLDPAESESPTPTTDDAEAEATTDAPQDANTDTSIEWLVGAVDAQHQPGQGVADQAAFAGARRVAFVVDASGSLVDSFPRVLSRLVESIGDLPEEDAFTVIFFGADGVIEAQPVGLKWADPPSKRQVRRWIAPSNDNVEAWGRGDPIQALKLAVSYGVDEIVLFSDNLIGGRATEDDAKDSLLEIADLIDGQVQHVHVIQFFDRDPHHVLKDIAQRFDGTYELIRSEPSAAANNTHAPNPGP